MTAARIFLLQRDMSIIYSGTNNLYIKPLAPYGPPNTSDSQISAGKATGHVEKLSETSTLPIPQLVADFTHTEYIMPSFTKTLVGVGPI